VGGEPARGDGRAGPARARRGVGGVGVSRDRAERGSPRGSDARSTSAGLRKRGPGLSWWGANAPAGGREERRTGRGGCGDAGPEHFARRAMRRSASVSLGRSGGASLPGADWVGAGRVFGRSSRRSTEMWTREGCVVATSETGRSLLAIPRGPSMPPRRRTRGERQREHCVARRSGLQRRRAGRPVGETPGRAAGTEWKPSPPTRSGCGAPRRGGRCAWP